MDKLKMHSKDMVQAHIEQIGALFPNCVTETIRDGKVVRAIDFDMLRQELSEVIVEGSAERYQFTWPEKRKSLLAANAPTTRTLRPKREKSVNFDATENLYIEGDNLEALKLLQETYLGKIKMIYIDPPYNTGSDLVYDDDFAESAAAYIERSGEIDADGNRLFVNNDGNGRFHTDWLNMMYPRLRLAKDLLSPFGLIFISLDDNEAVNLKKICDEVFGASNFVGQITVVGNPRGRDYGGVARMHDYVFVYRKSGEAVVNLIEDSESSFKMADQWGGFELRELRNRNIKFNKENRPNLYYPFYIDPNDADEHGLHTIALEPQPGWIELYPLESQGVNTVWRWGKPKSLANLNIHIKAKPMRNGSYMIVEKYREARVMARSVWWDKDTNTEKGTLLVKELMEGKVFDYPKPVEMLMRMLEMGTDHDTGDIVLDFFSGSGTMAHAVMQLNAKDSGNRKFIMVQLPEATPIDSEARKHGYSTICDIGEERIRRAGKRIKDNDPLTTADLDVGFRVLAVDSSNMEDVYYKPEEYTIQTLFSMADNIKPDRTPEDLLFQVMLDLGILLDSKIEETVIGGKKVFSVADGYLIACFDSNVTDAVVKAIAQMQPYFAVFRDSGFSSDSVATNFEQIFETYSPSTTRKVL